LQASYEVTHNTMSSVMMDCSIC